ncbi:MAG: ThuA domain-containing protein [Acidobacteria bacterium]|nr:ThuA domain-containing protein [Acidobacteriota bacterium]
MKRHPWLGALVFVFLLVAASAPAPAQGWDRVRSAALPVLGWRLGVSASGFRGLTLLDTLKRAASMGPRNIEGYSLQPVGGDIAKNLDWNLSEAEVTAVRERLRQSGFRMPVYRVASFPAGDTEVRKMFEFAKALGVEAVVAETQPGALASIEPLAAQYGIRVALGADSATPVETLRQLKDRALTVRVAAGAPGLRKFLFDLYRLELKPAMIALECAPDQTAAAAEALEKALTPVMAERVNQISRTTPARTKLSEEDRRKIEAALPARAPARPKKPRKLLVVDLNVAYPGHRAIPHLNLALERMGQRTGAYEAVFDNDLANLRWEKIRRYDAIFLNNTVGMIFVDPEVRAGLSRFVRQGGGLGGNHGTPHASMDWPEFAEMFGAKGGAHHDPDEKVTVNLDEPKSPINAAFQGRPFTFEDEYFRWGANTPYSREKLHLLVSFDVSKTDMNQGKPCPACERADNDYGISWIRRYGKGRVFYCSLGHNPTAFWTPPILEHFLAGVQFLLGDLKADTTPSARQRRK